MYKQKLIALLEGLEAQNIHKFVELSCEHHRRLGQEITKYAKIGAVMDLVNLKDEITQIRQDGIGLGEK